MMRNLKSKRLRLWNLLANQNLFASPHYLMQVVARRFARVETMKNSIAVRIARLRKKLIDLGAAGGVFESIRNIGYQMLVYVEIL